MRADLAVSRSAGEESQNVELPRRELERFDAAFGGASDASR